MPVRDLTCYIVGVMGGRTAFLCPSTPPCLLRARPHDTPQHDTHEHQQQQQLSDLLGVPASTGNSTFYSFK